MRSPWTAALSPTIAMLMAVSCAEDPLTPDPSELANSRFQATADWMAGQSALDYSAEVARSWMELSYLLVKAERWSPPVASRLWGYAGVTLYQAIQPGIPGSRSLERQLNGLEDVPNSPGRAHHWPAVANAALNLVFSEFFSQAAPESRARIMELYDQLASEYGNEISLARFEASEAFGVAVGRAILDWAAADGYSDLHDCAYTPPIGPGLWVPTPPAFLPPLEPCWGRIRTCAVPSGEDCDPGLHPPYSEDEGSPFYTEGLEVFETVRDLTPEQLAIAQFWADSPGQTGTPPGHWIRLLGQLLGEWDSTLDVAAEAYAKVGLAEMDAFICCWFTKYELNLLRPVTYIRALFDPEWLPPIVTPPFPEYTSGHSTQSAAVAEVLTDMFGDVSFTDHTHDDIGLPPRSFGSFQEASEEAAISRLFGGIHYRAALENGIKQGQCVGEQVKALVFTERLTGR